MAQGVGITSNASLIFSSKNNLTICRQGQTVLRMAERRLVILKYMLRTPRLATCAGCHLKFFTPLELLSRPVEAEEHLRDKFAGHTCRPSFHSQDEAERK